MLARLFALLRTLLGRPSSLVPVPDEAPDELPKDNPKPAKATALDRVRTAPLSLTPLFNGAELKTLAAIRREVKALGLPAQVFGQVALPEVIDAGSRYDKGGAYIAIEGRRLDFLVTDRLCRPVLAIEYDGPLHEGAKAQRRDAVKDTALERAGLPCLRLRHTLTEAERQVALRAALEGAFGVAA